MDPIAAYVINRAQDTDRLAQFRERNGKWPLDIRVVEAIDGHAESFSLADYGHELRFGWYDRTSIKPGAFACFLSHRKAWQMIAEGSEPHGFVFEDDAIVCKSPENILPVIGTAEVCYANKRMSTWCEEPVPTDLNLCISGRLTNGTPLREQGLTMTFGGDCYWMTRAGARALLAQVERFGIRGDVDYFIASVGFRPGDIPDPLPEVLKDFRWLEMFRQIVPETPVTTYVLGNWLTITRGESVLDHTKRTPLVT